MTPADEPDESDEQDEPDDGVLLLNRDRFKVDVDWHSFSDSGSLDGAAAVVSPDDGLLWFFNEDNWEVLVKVLDGCDFNAHYWVFAATATSVEYTLTVTDTQTDSAQNYENMLGRTSPAVTDTQAFATCP